MKSIWDESVFYRRGGGQTQKMWGGGGPHRESHSFFSLWGLSRVILWCLKRRDAQMCVSSCRVKPRRPGLVANLFGQCGPKRKEKERNFGRRVVRRRGGSLEGGRGSRGRVQEMRRRVRGFGFRKRERGNETNTVCSSSANCFRFRPISTWANSTLATVSRVLILGLAGQKPEL